MKQARLAAAFILLLAPGAGAQDVFSRHQANSSSPAAQNDRAAREAEEMRADIMMARKQYAEAVPVYKKLLQDEPRNAVLLNKLGIAYQQQVMLQDAKRCYERAVKADKTYAFALNNIGTIHYQRKNFRKAVQSYKKALLVNPASSAFYSNLGYAYFAEKHYEEAMEALHRALEIDPGVFDANHRAGPLLQNRQVDDRGLFYFLLAKSFASLGNVERCAHYLKKSWDEGYTGIASAQTDPAFARVIRDPGIQEILLPASPSANKPPVTPPGQ